MQPVELYSPKRFAIGLSFAGEKREFVRAVADELVKELSQAAVLYDHFHREEFAAPSLHLKLPDFYANDCEVVVVFICKFYAGKNWTRDEWRAIQDLILNREEERVVFVQFEDADLPGLRKGDGYLDANRETPQFVAESAIKRLQRVRNSQQQNAIDNLAHAKPAATPVQISATTSVAPPSGARERVLKQRLEELQDRMGHMLETSGSELTSELRQSLRRGDRQAATAVKEKLEDLLISNGVLIDSVIRCRGFTLLADYELQLAADGPKELQTTAARKMLEMAKANAGIDLEEEDSARLVSLEARLDYLDGRHDAALNALDGLVDPISLTARLAILCEERRFGDASKLISDRELHERWADFAVRIHVVCDRLSDAEAICEWAKCQNDQTSYHRCVLGLGQAIFNKALGTNSLGSVVFPEAVSPEQRDGLRLAMNALKPLLQAADAAGRITTGLQQDAFELVLQISFLTESHDIAPTAARMLTSYSPISQEVGRAIVWGYLAATDEIVQRLRTEWPSSFEAHHLAAVIEGGWLHRTSQSLAAARTMAGSFTAPFERERIATLCSQLTDVLSLDEQEQAYDLLVQMVGADHRLARYAQAQKQLRAGNLDAVTEFLQKANEPNDLGWREMSASCKEKRGDFEGAMNDLVFITCHCSEPSILWRTATLAAKAKRWETAAILLERVVQRDPKSDQALEQLASAHLQRQVSEANLRASECFSQLAARNPDNPRYGFNHAQVLAQLGRLDEAVAVLQAVCDRHPDFLPGFMVRSQILLALRRPQEAFTLLDQPNVRQNFWSEIAFLQLYMSLGYRARREDAAAQAMRRILELEQHLDEPKRSLRQFDLEQMKEFFQDVAATHRQLNEMVVRGQLPWICVALLQHRAVYGAWLFRTQAIVVSENTQDRGRFTTYSTNGFTVRPTEERRPFLRRLALHAINGTFVVDVTSLMTLDRLHMLDSVIEFLGHVIVPQEFVQSSLRDRTELQPQQAAQRDSANAIARAIDARIIVETDDSTLTIVDEFSDGSDAQVYRLFDLLEYLRESSRLADDEYEKLAIHAIKRSEGLPPLKESVRNGLVRIDRTMLEFLHSVGLFDLVIDVFRVAVPRDEAFEVRQSVYAYEKLDEVWAWNDELFTKLHNHSRCTFESACDENLDDAEAPANLQHAIAAASLAVKKRLPLVADDRVCQMLVLNSAPRDERVAIGTDILLEALADHGRITGDQLADCYLKLIDWRYRFLLVPSAVLRTLALRFRHSGPGEPLERIARYMHDCVADAGLFVGSEPTEPKISMAIYYGMQWINQVAEFVSTTWDGNDFDDSQATALTYWALTECLPAPSITMPPSDQLNFSLHTSELVVSHLLIRRASQADKSRSGTLMGVLQDALSMPRGDFCRIAAQIAAAYSRSDVDG